jgi:hypothetical protein
MDASKTTNELEISIRQLNSLVPNIEPHPILGVSLCNRRVERILGPIYAQRMVDLSHLMMDASLTTTGMEMHMREQKKWGLRRHPVHMDLESDTKDDHAKMMMMVD